MFLFYGKVMHAISEILNILDCFRIIAQLFHLVRGNHRSLNMNKMQESGKDDVKVIDVNCIDHPFHDNPIKINL